MGNLILLLLAAICVAPISGWSYLHRFSTSLLSMPRNVKEEFNQPTANPAITNFVQNCGILLFCFAAPVFAAEIELPQSMKGPLDAPYSFHFTEDLISAPKLVKTHQLEIFLKSEKVKGFNVGLTVDPVKIKSITEFSSAPKLAERVLAVEKGKEGFIDGSVITTTETAIATNDGQNIPIYDLDYQVETTRGLNHFRVRTVIAGKKLYVFTAQCRQDSYPTLAPVMQDILSSFQLQS